MTDIDYAARVAKGIALLDVKWPEWATEIDLDRLDIQNGSSCLTAQYARKQGRDSWFTVGQGLLGLSQGDYENHGFDVDADVDTRLMDPVYETLNGLWKAEIEHRRTAATPEASER